MTKLALILIEQYKKYLSPSNRGMQICRFEPSCSRYTHEAIAKHGLLRGGIIGAWRILRCNPFNKGGYDPVK